MPGRTGSRLDFMSSDSSSSIDGFPNSRVSPTVYIQRVGETSSDAVSMQPPVKRRKSAGLNSRFDRMLDRVALNLSTPSPYQRRRRAPSSGSSSIGGSSDVPKTPVDAYIGADEGRLGKGFSVLKLSGNLPTWADHAHGDQDPFETTYTAFAQEPLPPWLCQTFSTLPTSHPLRLSVSHTNTNASHETIPVEESREPQDDTKLEDEEQIFAFVPPSPSPTARTAARSQELQVRHDKHIPHDAFLDNMDDQLLEPVLDTVPGNELMYLSDPSHLIQTDRLSETIPFSNPGPNAYHPTLSPLRSFSSQLVPQSPPTVNIGTLPLSAVDGDPDWTTLSDFGQTKTTYTPQLTSISGLRLHTPTHRSSTPPPSTLPDYPYNTDSFLQTSRIPFSTPGPTFQFHAPPFAYFDSPIEDPLKPESQVTFDVDMDLHGVVLEDLDFRWTAFPRDERIDVEHQEPGQEQANDYEEENDEEQQGLYVAVDVTHRDVLYASDDIANQDFFVVRTQSVPPLEQTPSEDDEPRGKAFAPAPGIYLSPLHTPESSPRLEGRVENAQAVSSTPKKDGRGTIPNIDVRSTIIMDDVTPNGTIDAVHCRTVSCRRYLQDQHEGMDSRVQGDDALHAELLEAVQDPSCSQLSNDSIESWSG